MRRSRLSEITGQGSPPATEAIRRPLLTLEEARILKAWMHAPTTPPTVAARARIIRFAAAGLSNSEIARELGVSRGTVILWRERFEREGLLSLTEVRPGRGRRPSVSIRAAKQILGSARAGKGGVASAATYTEQAAAYGVSPATVYRVWDAHGLPRRASPASDVDRTGPRLVGVYLDPPDRILALVGGVAAEIGTLPNALGRALDRFDRVASGASSFRDRERAFLKFLRQVERSAAGAPPTRLVVGAGSGVHERPAVAGWIRAHGLRIELGEATACRLLERTGAIASPRSPRGALAAALTADLRGWLSSYDGELDRFVWLASVD